METPGNLLRRLRTLVLPIAAAGAILLPYSNHFRNSFHFDDIHTIVDNPAVRTVANIPRFFTDATTFSVLPANRTYRPVLSSTLAIDYRLAHGYNPAIFHVDSFLFFLLQLGCMFALFVRLLEGNRLVALLAATLYGLHPAMAETVNYIIQRGDILSTLGVVAALLIYVRWPDVRRFGLYLVPLAMGLLAKPPAAIFPALLLLYLVVYRPQRKIARTLSAIVPSAAMTAAILVLESRLTPKTFAPSDLSEASYLLTQPFVAMRYFVAFFLPLHLNVDTDLQPFSVVTGQAVLGIVFLLLLLTTTVVLVRRSRADGALRPIAFGLGWFVLTLLPTSLYKLAEVENDHRMYLPFAGLVLAATCTLARVYEGLADRAATRRVATAGVVLLAIAYGFGTYRRNAVWRNEETLWLDDVQKSPHNGRGLMIYGLTQMDKGDFDRALHFFELAERYTPTYPTLQINLGVVYGSIATFRGDAGARMLAEQHFLRALTLAPTDDLPHLYYGRWLASETRTPEAISQLRTALLLNPARIEPHNLLTQALLTEGDFDEARASAMATLALAPGDPAANALLASVDRPTAEAWLNRSLAAYRQKDYAACIAAAQHAVVLRPGYAEAWNNIGAAYGALAEHDPSQWGPAIEADRRALALRPEFPLARNNLAWAESQKALHR